MTQAQAEKLGRLWEKNGMKRIYINGETIAKAIGLEVDYYKTGNVRSAKLNGEDISNSKASGIIGDIFSSKFWFDLTDGKFYIRSSRDWSSYQISKKLCNLADSLTIA